MNHEILIAEEITRDTFARILDETRHLTHADTLTLRINSNGGSAFDGLAIYDALTKLPCTRIAEIIGVCASAATLIAAACPTRIMSPGAVWMVHRSHIPVSGNVDDLATATALLEQIDARMVEIYAAITGRSPESIRADISTENFMSAQTALAGGWVTAIGTNEPDTTATAFDDLIAQVRDRLAAQPAAHLTLSELIARAGDLFRTPDAIEERKATAELAALKADFEALTAELAAARADADAARAELTRLSASIEEREQLAIAAALKNIGLPADDLPPTGEPPAPPAPDPAAIRKIGAEQGLAAAIDAWYSAGEHSSSHRSA